MNSPGLRHHWLLCLIVCPALFLFACNPVRKGIKEPIKPREEGVDFVFGKLKQNEFRFDWFSARFTAETIIDKKKTNLSGQVRILRDSLIWVSLTPALGLEAARILITLDSVLFLNRIDNTYLKSDFGFINNNLNSGFDFDLLRSLLMGNDLSFYENDQFKVGIDGMKYRLNTVGRRKLKKFVRHSGENQKVLVQSIWVDPASGKIDRVITKEPGKENKKLEVNYSGFQPVGEQLFPHHLSVSIDAEKKITIELDFSRIKWNEPLTTPFTIPSNYSPLR